MKAPAPKTKKPPLWLAVRAGEPLTPLLRAFTCTDFADARRLARLRGAPAGVLAAADAATLTELTVWLAALPVATRTVAYVPAAPDAELTALAKVVDCLLVDVAATGDVPDASFDRFARTFALLGPHTRVIPKLWAGRRDGDLAPDFHLLDELCTLAGMQGLRLALHFGDRHGPASPEAVRRLASEVQERFPAGADWGGFRPTEHYATYLAGMTDDLGWSRAGWDTALSDSERLQQAEALL